VSEGRYEVTFSAGGFLSQATGPLAAWYHDFVPNDHDWHTLLAMPRQDKPQDSSAAAPYQDWGDRIVKDWGAELAKVQTIAGLTEDQRAAAVSALNMRRQQLVDYLESEATAIKDYQHELWRLAQMRAEPEADVPYMKERIAAKQAELHGTPQKWLDQVNEFEQNYHDDLRNVLTDQQRVNASTTAAMDEAVTDPRAARLKSINKAVTMLTIGVGACLLLGFFTRLASLVGVAFLLGIIASQPPWAPDAVTTFFYYQCVEVMSLFVLAAVGAGRWLGLDSFSYALWHRLFGHSEA
jgi:uncharacterized membrane protein YphA (DoxX/SURF4 family)